MMLFPFNWREIQRKKIQFIIDNDAIMRENKLILRFSLNYRRLVYDEVLKLLNGSHLKMIKAASSQQSKSEYIFTPEPRSCYATCDSPKPLCRCLQIMKEQVEASCANPENDTLRDVIKDSKAGSGCNSCHSAIREILQAQKENADQKEFTCV